MYMYVNCTGLTMRIVVSWIQLQPHALKLEYFGGGQVVKLHTI